jgi:uroporphyrinogen decarboxylase
LRACQRATRPFRNRIAAARLLANRGAAPKPRLPAANHNINPILFIIWKEKRVASIPSDSPASAQSEKPLLAVLKGERRDPPPVWMMRQAGRYLPEYRELRERKGGFVDLVYDSDAAAEITLQPLKRFPQLDAAILFSDILIVPFAIGQNLSFVAGEGPRLTPPLATAQLDDLTPFPARLEPIYETVARVKAALDPSATLIGFAGAPWTAATYMVAGQGSRDQSETRRLAYADPERLAAIVSRIEEVTLDYLGGQIEAGAEAVQLFDSWAGSLAPSEFERWVIAPTARIVSALKQRYPSLPVIGFPKGAGGKLAGYARETGVDAIGLDETVDPAWAHRELPPGMPLQGNLDPLALLAGGEALEGAVRRILDALAERPHIFNLGHGILQDTPVAHVEQLLRLVKGGEWNS